MKINVEEIKKKALAWTGEEFDKETREKVKWLIDNDEKELVDAFYKDLEFGTGGLRGIMGAGTNRMNIYTVGMATQGLANYLRKSFEGKEIKVAIAYDSRNNSKLFATTAAEILSANGIKVFIFDDIRPTPELSFAVRYLHCQSGIVITASHNPKEYNGYKVYWEDGGQIVPPHDKNIIEEVGKIKSVSQINFDKNESLITIIGEEVDNAYINEIKKLSLNSDLKKDLKIVYTPIHGTGIKMLPRVLEVYGFKDVITEPKQSIPDGNFPTVKSPNPENAEALSLAIKLAKQEGADLVLATDPDADRVAAGVKHHGDIELINGNQIASLLTYYILKHRTDLKSTDFIVKTIVTTDLLCDIAESFCVRCIEVLTGFKYIAEKIRINEGKQRFICGGEESYGFLTGDYTRDKDAISTGALLAEAAAWAKSQGKTLIDVLDDIYSEYSLYSEHLINVVKKGVEGAAQIAEIMERLRKAPFELPGLKIKETFDYKLQKIFDEEGEKPLLGFPVSNVLQFVYDDGTKVSVRPSGTEPKIKFYISVKSKFEGENSKIALHKKIENITAEIEKLVR
jgi:phosphoglucomutase